VQDNTDWAVDSPHRINGFVSRLAPIRHRRRVERSWLAHHPETPDEPR
jgi:hypothetical protein